MNWKYDQIEKLILFYSHNSLFLVPDIWYHKSCNWYQILVPVWCQFSGISFWSVCHGHYAELASSFQQLSRQSVVH